MTLRETVYSRCTTHAGIAALIDTRCYPDRLPENVTYPAISYIAPVSQADGDYRVQGAPPSRAVSRIQINCYDETGDGASALADQVRLAWSGYSDGCDVGYAFVANRISSREDAIDAYRMIVDVIVEHPV
jgi:hypothetical protein